MSDRACGDTAGHIGTRVAAYGRSAAPDELPVVETFVSLQGEGRWVGTPSSFIRLAGCNLRCVWCDTPNSSWAPVSERRTLGALVEFCARGPKHVVLTGGEPLLHPGLVPLAQDLAAGGHMITVETAGTLWLDDLKVDLASLSPKLRNADPSPRDPRLRVRHEAARLRPEVLQRFIDTAPAWQLKFVVRTETTAALAEDLIEVEAILGLLRIADTDRDRVLLMPEGVRAEALPAAYATLSPICTERGFTLGQRLHIALFGHTPGT